MKRSASHSLPRAGILASLAILFLASSCNGGLFRNLMEGKNGSAWAGDLKISPANGTIPVSTTLHLIASGGDGNYTYSLSGAGSIDPKSGIYTAPSTVGTDTVQVTDGGGRTAATLLYIVAGIFAPDYRVVRSPAPSFPAAAVAGGSFSGSFSIENISSKAGSQPITWKVYLSRDARLDPLDLMVASGTLAPPFPANSSSGPISFGGASCTWPVASPGTTGYFLVIEATAADDADTSNDWTASAAYIYAGLAPPDYSITNVTPVSATIRQTISAFSESLTITNTGGPGGSPATWSVYRSMDAIYDAQDTLVASGTISPDLGVGASISPTFTGSFPDMPGNYYFIAKVSAFDDGASGKKVLASGQITLTGPRYSLSSVSIPDAGLTGSSIAGARDFAIQNLGSGNGNYPIEWSVYASLAPALEAGAVLIASGSLAPLASGASQSLTPGYTGTWPPTVGSYFIVVTIQALDDLNGVRSLGSSSPILVSAPLPPDYSVSLANLPWSGVAGSALSSLPSVVITNTTGNPGLSTIFWNVYASTDQTWDLSDPLIASSFCPGLGPNATTSITLPVTSKWPSSPTGFLYLIAKISASDDVNTANNTAVASHPTAVGTYSYLEGVEDNSGVGPAPPNFNSKPTSATGAILSAGQTLAVEGTMDAAGAGDTYRFDTAAGVGNLRIQVRWKTGQNSMDLSLWSQAGTVTVAFSGDPAFDAEPGAAPLAVPGISAGSWYAGLGMIAPIVGQPYAMLIEALP
jgi:hypothetical protein